MDTTTLVTLAVLTLLVTIFAICVLTRNIFVDLHHAIRHAEKSIGGSSYKFLLYFGNSIEVKGGYKGRKATINIHPKYASVSLRGSKLPPQKWFMVSYSRVADNVVRIGRDLVMSIDITKLKSKHLGKSYLDDALNELDRLAHRLERPGQG